MLALAYDRPSLAAPDLHQPTWALLREQASDFLFFCRESATPVRSSNWF